jgi:hypothetical protein
MEMMSRKTLALLIVQILLAADLNEAIYANGKACLAGHVLWLAHPDACVKLIALSFSNSAPHAGFCRGVPWARCHAFLGYLNNISADRCF